MPLKSYRFAGELRQELCARNAAFACENKFSHVTSYGSVPVYAPESDGMQHGNFFRASYAEILKHPDWARRLTKIHAGARRSLPAADRKWRELDSSTSSDALLMNIFCCPGVCSDKLVASMLGTDVTDVPEFGHKARVPLANGKTDRTEVDLKLGSLLMEAKLTETNFQLKSRAVAESYRDFRKIFIAGKLPRAGDQYVSYQLLRNVLAAYNSGASFCVVTDARRPDLIEAWHDIMRCVRDHELKTRCKVLTWQELCPLLPEKLQGFLDVKYGIRGSA